MLQFLRTKFGKYQLAIVIFGQEQYQYQNGPIFVEELSESSNFGSEHLPAARKRCGIIAVHYSATQITIFSPRESAAQRDGQIDERSETDQFGFDWKKSNNIKRLYFKRRRR